jgi:beta-galactosidase
MPRGGAKRVVVVARCARGQLNTYSSVANWLVEDQIVLAHRNSNVMTAQNFHDKVNRIRIMIIAGVTVTLAPVMQPSARANDSMFAPQPAAQATVNFDGRGFLINGQRVFVVSAGMEYARVPQPLWADRLMRFKRAGFNCTEFYTFWNYHEAQSGQFNFSTNCDLDAYLKLAKSLGLYATARVGPYYCAEWDSGGYPIWLRNVPNLQVRTANAAFEQYVTRYWGQLLPIVFSNQINLGGNVIMVQLENEHPNGWGTDGLGNAYFQYLQSTALGAGLEVPYFFSGLNHSSDPAGTTPWSSAARTSPWMSTEFWCDWYSNYGESASDASGKDWSTWKIIAYGGNGYNYYMAHGGTDFDYFNDDEIAASYDYGSAVGQTGDLRPEYYKFKRAAWFARSFQNILETSDNATSAYAGAATNTALAVTARQGAAGTILFLCNSGTSARQTVVNINGVAYPQTGALTVNASEIMPVVTQYPLIPGVMLSVAPTRILGITQQAGTTTMVIYGQTGSPAELYFNVPAGTTISAGAAAMSLNGTNLTLRTTYPASGASNFSFQTGSQRVRILAVSDTLADDTWFVDVNTQTYVVCGPQYVGNGMVTNSYLQLITEAPWQNAATNPVTAYGPGDTPMSLSVITTPGTHPGAAALTAWQTMSGTAQAAAGYDTSAWLSSSSGPQQMGADGDVSNCAWYRTTINAPSAGAYAIFLGGVADAMIPFVDGTAVPAANITGSSFTAMLSAGSHTVAIFTTHYGRNKLYPYVGPISQMYVKGLSGPAYLLQNLESGPTSLTSWKVMMTNSTAVGLLPPATNASGWSNYTVGTDAFGGQTGYAWFQTVLPPVPSAGTEIANFSSVDDNGWVYLNGTLLTTNYGWNVPFNSNLTSAWNAGGSNVLTVLVQNTGGAGGLYSGVTFSAYQSEATLTNWVQQGGPGNPNATIGWQTLSGGATFSGPQFFKSTFTAPPFGTTGTDPMWRVTTTGLSHGSVWVNGHNLGRYPEKVAAPGIYVPECWLNAGANANTLVIYDEGGKLPTQVKVQPEAAASRDVATFQSTQIVTLSAPPAPIGLTATASGTQVTLAWNVSPGAISYNVKRSAASGQETTAAVCTTTNYTDTALAGGTTYYYVISAVDVNNESANSGEVAATTGANLALNKPASADSQQAGNSASNANDGNTGTRWCANDGNLNHWWQVDLGAVLNLSGDEVLWEKNGAVYDYTVAVSTNNTTWTTVVNKGANTSTAQDQTDSFIASGRYVRITVTGLTGGDWASFYEFRVFGTDSTNTTLANGCFFIINRNSAQALDAAGGGTTNGTPIDQWTFNGNANQAWALTNLGSGQYQIIGLQCGLSLDVPGDSTTQGADLDLWTPNGGANQKWMITPASAGYYTIQGVGSGLSLNVSGSSTAQGALVEQRGGVGAAGQWSLNAAAHLPLVQGQTLAGQMVLQAVVFQGQTCVLETSTNLTQWWPVATNTATGAGWLALSNGISAGDACRYYRVQFVQ